jgi:hypothetical protein
MSSPRLGGLLLTLAFAASLQSNAFAQTAPSPEPQIQRLLTKQEVAWNIGDSASFGSAFTEDADFINILGQVFHGRLLRSTRSSSTVSSRAATQRFRCASSGRSRPM